MTAFGKIGRCCPRPGFCGRAPITSSPAAMQRTRLVHGANDRCHTRSCSIEPGRPKGCGRPRTDSGNPQKWPIGRKFSTEPSWDQAYSRSASRTPFSSLGASPSFIRRETSSDGIAQRPGLCAPPREWRLTPQMAKANGACPCRPALAIALPRLHAHRSAQSVVCRQVRHSRVLLARPRCRVCRARPTSR